MSPAATTTRLADVADWVAARADAVDDHAADPFAVVRRLAGEGLIALGAPGAPGTLADMVEVLRTLAGRCMASAFVAWSHRMAVEYLSRAGTDWLRRAVLPDLVAGTRPGSTALASAFRDHAGLAELGVTAAVEGSGWVLDGTVPWASNLAPEAVVVLAAREAGGRRLLAAVPVATAGFEVRHLTDLLALGATRSGTLTLRAVHIDPDQVLDGDVADFLDGVRPTFLLLQTALCLGLADASLAAVSTVPRVFRADHTSLVAQHHEVSERLATLAGAADPPDPATRPFVQLRHDAAEVAIRATHLELRLMGGRAYVRTSPTARRLREALFLPVQSPTEGQLRWELSQYA